VIGGLVGVVVGVGVPFIFADPPGAAVVIVCAVLGTLLGLLAPPVAVGVASYATYGRYLILTKLDEISAAIAIESAHPVEPTGPLVTDELAHLRTRYTEGVNLRTACPAGPADYPAPRYEERFHAWIARTAGDLGGRMEFQSDFLADPPSEAVAGFHPLRVQLNYKMAVLDTIIRHIEGEAGVQHVG
jgi:hypothetical protein